MSIWKVILRMVKVGAAVFGVAFVGWWIFDLITGYTPGIALLYFWDRCFEIPWWMVYVKDGMYFAAGSAMALALYVSATTKRTEPKEKAPWSNLIWMSVLGSIIGVLFGVIFLSQVEKEGHELFIFIMSSLAAIFVLFGYFMLEGKSLRDEKGILLAGLAAFPIISAAIGGPVAWVFATAIWLVTVIIFNLGTIAKFVWK